MLISAIPAPAEKMKANRKFLTISVFLGAILFIVIRFTSSPQSAVSVVGNLTTREVEEIEAKVYRARRMELITNWSFLSPRKDAHNLGIWIKGHIRVVELEEPPHMVYVTLSSSTNLDSYEATYYILKHTSNGWTIFMSGGMPFGKDTRSLE